MSREKLLIGLLNDIIASLENGEVIVNTCAGWNWANDMANVTKKADSVVQMVFTGKSRITIDLIDLSEQKSFYKLLNDTNELMVLNE